MRIALNAWFLDQPDTGSGQYLRALLQHLPAAAQAQGIPLTLLLIGRAGQSLPPELSHCEFYPLALKPGALGKVQFEQMGVPRQAQKLRADLLHIPYWAPPMRAEMPFIVTVHDIIPKLLPEHRGSLLGRLYTSLVSATTHGASHIITDSFAARLDILEHLKIEATRVTAIHLACDRQYRPRRDASDWEVRQKYQLPNQYLLYLGGFHRRKNVHLLLAAWTYCHAPIGDFFPLVIAGKLPENASTLLPDLPALAKQYEIEASVRFIGRVEEAEKPALYRNAAGFVFPSSYEGFGLPPLESMACGTPVITTDKSSLPEVVGDSAYLVSDPQETQKLAAALIGLTVDQELHSSLHAKGLLQAQKFSWHHTAEKTLAIYCANLTTATH